MRSLVHVISDLHLGGAPGSVDDSGFQMCPPATHHLLVKFIDSLPESNFVLDSHLVIAGDIVDFLAESPFMPFTGDPALAEEKLQRIFESTSVFWEALSRFVEERNGVLTLILGNHDIELSLPGVRQMLLEHIGGQRTRFIYDNEAFILGPLLIEHGNRFDAWNAVPHSALRRVRSQLSRKLPVIPEFPALPGSRMVIDVINPLKLEYPFVDLLKPETAIALPIAAALGGIGLKEVWKTFGKFRASHSVDYDEESGEPINPNYIRGAANTDQPLWDAAQSIAAAGNIAQISGLTDTLRGVGTTAKAVLRSARIEALFTAFRKLAELRRMHREAFSLEHESDTYLNPARRSALSGFKAIVYGHTHLPKWVSLTSADEEQAIYLNTGTWADVMCIPDGIWDPDEPAGRTLFRRFCDDLDTEALAGWRRSMPTYARIEVDGDQLFSAQLHFADDNSLATTEGVWKRLVRESAS